jgi:hypothetical protein
MGRKLMLNLETVRELWYTGSLSLLLPTYTGGRLNIFHVSRPERMSISEAL